MNVYPQAGGIEGKSEVENSSDIALMGVGYSKALDTRPFLRNPKNEISLTGRFPFRFS